MLIQPTGLDEFHSKFPTEEACVDYLLQIKWPNGYRCCRCGCLSAYKTSTRRLPLFECAGCGYQATPIVGTVIEGSRTDLRKWFLALFLLSQESSNTNALNLSRTIEVTYKTAWLILQKIRYMMGEEDARIRLSGFVNVIGAVYGRPYNPTILRHPQETPVLVGASINDRQEPEYVKIKLIPDEHLGKTSCILRRGTEVFTKQHMDFGATAEFITKKYVPLYLKPTYPLFIASQKWINNTFHGLGRRHLQSYLNEYCFRLNYKLNKESIFAPLTQLCFTTKTLTYSKLIS